jgi:hypothetical protein
MSQQSAVEKLRQQFEAGQKIWRRPTIEAVLRQVELDMHNLNVALKHEHEENQRVRMALMPSLESEDPAEAVEVMKTERDESIASVRFLEEALQSNLKEIVLSLSEVSTCSFCGQETSKTPDAMQAHMLICEKHPMQKYKQFAERFAALVEEALDDPEGFNYHTGYELLKEWKSCSSKATG